MAKMTGKQALSIIKRQAPCPHDNADTSLGVGGVWAKCEDCGATFAVSDWPRARVTAKEFDEAVWRLRPLSS